MSGEPTIVVQDVTKKYRLFASKRDRMREALDPFRRTYHREFWALKNVSFTVSRGQTVGKMVWGTRVRDAATGGALGPAKAAVRYLAPALLSFVTFGLIWFPDGLWLFWDRRRQTLHDKVAGSVVVNA